MKYICITCGVQFADSVLPPEHCAICEDERQYVGHGGQKWTTLKEMGVTYRNQLDVEAPELISMATEPKFAIGQRALHVRREPAFCGTASASSTTAVWGRCRRLEAFPPSRSHTRTTTRP